MPETTQADVIIRHLTAQANQILSSVLGTADLQAFNTGGKGNLPYYWQNPRNLEFNAATYNWINANLEAGTTPLELDQVFSNLYLDALSKVNYSLSTDDQAKLNEAHRAATEQQTAVLNSWKAAFGDFPPGDGQPIDRIAATIATKWADPPTTLSKIQQSRNPTQLLNNVPASGQTVVPVFSAWLNAIGSSISLQNNVTMNNAYLADALRAVQEPSTTNGGLTLDDGTMVPAYRVATSLSDILNGLKAEENVASLEMRVSRGTEDEYTVDISGGTSFRIPIFSLLTLNVGGQAHYFSSEMATSHAETTVKLNYSGVTLVNYAPVDFNQSTLQSWYWMKPIQDAIHNGDSADVSGFKFSPMPQIDFSESGPFGFLHGAAISNYPSLEITVKSSNWQRIQETFEQSSSVGISFLGIPLGIGGRESSYSNHVEVDASAQTVKITLDPPKELVAGQAVDSVGWVLGVLPKFPAA